MRTFARLFGFASGLLVVAGIIASCAPDTTAPTLQRQPTNAPPTLDDTVAAAVTVDNIQAYVPPFTDTACLDCHSDQAAMVDLAKPKESGHGELSSGPG